MLLRMGMFVVFVFVVISLGGCSALNKAVSNSSGNANAESKSANENAVKPNEDGTIPSGTGTEKQKPAAGKANVQGKAFFNDKPAVGVEVKLCKTFSQFMGGCRGKTYTAKTDDAGEYLITDVEPGEYKGLTVKVFDTPYFVFATSGIITAAKYNLEADKTYFAPDSNLFKSDLKLTSPKAGSKVPAENLEVKWEAYPDAAYYKVSLYANADSGAKANYDYINKRIDGESMSVDTPLDPGTYTCKIEAFNANDRLIAQTTDDMKFTINGTK